MANLYIAIDGIQYATDRLVSSQKVVFDSATITDIVNDTPSRAQLTVRGFVPTKYQELTISLGSDRIFGGTITTVEQFYVGTPTNYSCHVSATDFTALLNRRKVWQQYVGQSATTIAQDLVATYATGFTTVHVAAGLPTVDLISFTGEDVAACLTQLVKRIGGYWYCDYYRDVHVFLSESGDDPTALTPTHESLTAFAVTEDVSQVVTRVLVEGGGGNALADCAPGETIIPVDTPDWYAETGGTVRSGPQRITYASMVSGGGGTLVGPGASPSAPLGLDPIETSGSVDNGAHDWAATFVTAAGESLSSPIASFTTGVLAAPGSTLPHQGPYAGGSIDVGDHKYGVTFVTAAGETTLGQNSALIGVSAGLQTLVLTSIAIGPPGVTARKLYRIKANQYSGPFKLVTTINDNVTQTYVDTMADASLGADAPTVNTAFRQQVAISGIPIGPAAVTNRKLYRTAIGSSQLKLLATIGDNTTTTYTDNLADSTLGANAPTSDTSGLTQPTGQVIAGSTSLLVAGTSAFESSGGWAVIGNGQQAIRYTGITGSSLTGIPATGAGAILAAISYNSTVTAAPQLTGVPASGAGAILYSILKGDAVNLFVQVDDTIAQTTLAALLTVTLGASSDGVQEELLQDNRISETEAIAKGLALLALRKFAEVSISYTCRDPLTRSGRTISVDLPAPMSVTGDFKIQEVTISNFHSGEGVLLYPDFAVKASTTRFSLEDLLRAAHQRAK